jgi:hypothetical protein
VIAGWAARAATATAEIAAALEQIGHITRGRLDQAITS